MVISYDKKYKTSDLETVTLRQDYDDSSHKKKYCILFTGAEGVKGLLVQVKERFDAISEKPVSVFVEARPARH